MSETRLILPLPVSPNSWGGHPIAVQVRKDRYRAQVWASAVRQAMPRAVQDLPQRVRIDVELSVWNRLDDDNATASCKWLIDALKAVQTGRCRWRAGVYETKGYLIDDGPAHMELGDVVQHVDRKKLGSRAVVTIREVG
jgi:hypothetical protein